MIREYGVAVRRPVPAHATMAAVESALPMTSAREIELAAFPALSLRLQQYDCYQILKRLQQLPMQ